MNLLVLLQSDSADHAALFQAEGDRVDRLLLLALGGAEIGARLAEDPGIKAACRHLLWNQAVACFKEKRWERAIPLFKVPVRAVPAWGACWPDEGIPQQDEEISLPGEDIL